MRRERVEYLDPERIEMALVEGDHHQFVRLGDGSDRDIGKASMPTRGLAGIAERAGYPRRSEIERQHAIGINSDNAIEPHAQSFCAPSGAGAKKLGDAGLDLGSRYRRQVQFVSAIVEPSSGIGWYRMPSRREGTQHIGTEQPACHRSGTRNGDGSRSNSISTGMLFNSATKLGLSMG